MEGPQAQGELPRPCLAAESIWCLHAPLPSVFQSRWLAEGEAANSGLWKGKVVHTCNPSAKEYQEFKDILNPKGPSSNSQ